ncbi:hypothetical protein NONI108955_22535 [Nocardia ninae]
MCGEFLSGTYSIPDRVDELQFNIIYRRFRLDRSQAPGVPDIDVIQYPTSIVPECDCGQ